MSDKRLDSPSIPIATGSAQLTFRNNYYTETTFDGGVLEISIGGEPFQDIRAAGGSLVVGTYSGTLQTGLDNPLSGRLAWTGNSNNGFITSVVTLPPSAAGQNVVLRWRLGTDNAIGAPGWRIDTIKISECLGSPPPPPHLRLRLHRPRLRRRLLHLHRRLRLRHRSARWDRLR